MYAFTAFPGKAGISSNTRKKNKFKNKSGPIILIEDDPEDLEIFSEVFTDLDCQNEIIYFMIATALES